MLVLSLSLAIVGCVLFLSLAHIFIERKNQEAKVATIVRVLRDCQDDAQDMETGQRGYLLTNESAYLEPFNHGRDQFIKHLAELDDLVRMNSPSDIEMPRKLASLMRLKEVEMGATIELQKEGSDFEALQIVKSGQGKRYMDDIRMLISDYAERYRQQRHNQENEAVTGLWQAEAAFISWIGSIAALIATALWKVHDAQRLLKSDQIAQSACGS